jgi:hypothetical protein
MAQCLRAKGGAAAAVGDVLRKAAPWRREATASYHHTIQAVPRETAGPRAAARERRKGNVPAVLLSLDGSGPGEGVAHRKLLTTDRKQLGEMLKQSPYFLSTPVRLQVRAGERSTAVVHSGTVLPIKVCIPVILISIIDCNHLLSMRPGSAFFVFFAVEMLFAHIVFDEMTSCCSQFAGCYMVW